MGNFRQLRSGAATAATAATAAIAPIGAIAPIVAIVACALGLAATSRALDDPPSGGDAEEPKSLPQDGIFSSIKQSLNQDIDHDAVRGYFELGSAPNVRRYYCLVSTKTGHREPNGVLGDPFRRPDGTVGIRNNSVSMYNCSKAEQQGMLVTTGYVLSGRAATANASASPAPAPRQPTSAPVPVAPPPPSPTAMSPAGAAVHLAPGEIDIGGVTLGMSPDEVRAVLKAKQLLDYNESAETLSYLDSAKGTMQPIPNGRFVNVISAWTPPPVSGGGDSFLVDGESYQVMFTPVPAGERVMSIVHTVGYSPVKAVRETALESGLIKKYGGFGTNDLPESPTWRLQSGGDVQSGDPCGRRALFGGLGSLTPAKERENLAMKRTPDDFKSDIDRCGVAIVTEDHFTANGGALHEDRLVTRFTVSAYSPAMALEGAKTAARLIHGAPGMEQKLDSASKNQPSL